MRIALPAAGLLNSFTARLWSTSGGILRALQINSKSFDSSVGECECEPSRAVPVWQNNRFSDRYKAKMRAAATTKRVTAWVLDIGKQRVAW